MTNILDEGVIFVVMETALGQIELELYPRRAPKSVANFLAYVDAGHYDSSYFYRATGGGDTPHAVVQGGVFPRLAKGVTMENWANILPLLPPVEHESTKDTGLKNNVGVIALARTEPGTASSEFFVNMAHNDVLDTGVERDGRDGYGYATFGRVVRGMGVLVRIEALGRDSEAPIDSMKGQMLSDPVVIGRMYRVSIAGGS